MSKPNIICISIDSARADYCLGNHHTPSITPFLNQLADESTVYESAISPSVFTLPVHTSIFTGLFPPEHGITWKDKTLGDHPTFAEILESNGYRTNAFYNNGWLDSGEILRGFSDDRPESSGSSGKVESALSQITQSLPKSIANLAGSIHSFQQTFRAWQNDLDPSKVDKGGAHIIDQVKNHLSRTDEPFCWFVHLNDAHYGGGYSPPSPYHNRFTNESNFRLSYNRAIWQRRIFNDRISKRRVVSGDITVPDNEAEMMRSLYKGSLTYCDSLIEDLTDELRREGVLDNTVLVIFGDHGESFGENNVFGHHCSVDDSLIRVPLLIRDPTGQLPPQTVSSPVSLVDIYPTVLSLSGTSGPTTNAVDLTSSMRDYAYTYYVDEGTNTIPESDLASIKGELPPKEMNVIWKDEEQKLIFYPQEQAYNGPSEDDERLRSQLHEHKQSLTKVKSKHNSLDRDTVGQLKQMGYL